MGVIKDDKFEDVIIKRIKNMHADYMYCRRCYCYNTGSEYKEQWYFYNPLGGIWNLRINLRFEYVNKKIDEKYEAEVRRLMP